MFSETQSPLIKAADNLFAYKSQWLEVTAIKFH